MFFAERISNIKPEYTVLEIGPGANPYFRSDVLIELHYYSQEDMESHFGYKERLKTDKNIVYYDGQRFTFADNEVDETVNIFEVIHS